MAYTGMAYQDSFAGMVTSILKRNIKAIRAIIALNVIITLPAQAFIGIGGAIVSFGMTFNKKVKA